MRRFWSVFTRTVNLHGNLRLRNLVLKLLRVFTLQQASERSALRLTFLLRRNLLLRLPAITYLWNALDSEEKLRELGEYLETLWDQGIVSTTGS